MKNHYPSLFWAFIAACAVKGVDGFSIVSHTNLEWSSSRLLRIKTSCGTTLTRKTQLLGWVQGEDGEWEWQEDDPNFIATEPIIMPQQQQQQQEQSQDGSGETTITTTPKLPSGKLKPKQSLGQNYLRDPNTVAKFIRTFHQDATKYLDTVDNVLELGPGAGALTDPLVERYGTDIVQCIEVDDRAVEILEERHPKLHIQHADVLQVNYPQMAQDEGKPLIVIGNLPYYITSQILFALADASHFGAVHSATVTMQWEVAQRMVAPTCCKDYGILSVVFQLYADVNLHFKIPPTVFYPQPKVDSALVGLHFLGPTKLRERLVGVSPRDLRRVVTTAFRQRRKTIRNGLKKFVKSEICDGDTEEAQQLLNAEPLPLPAIVAKARDNGDVFAQTQELPKNWGSKRPEELSPGQFVELTRLLLGPKVDEGTVDIDEGLPLGSKVWRKLKHGSN